MASDSTNTSDTILHRGNSMKTRPDPALPSPARLHDVAGVASRLGVSEKTVRRMIDRAELPAHRIGRLLRVSEEDLADYLAKRRTVRI
jgi:excisionase family DNA binding protein